MDFVKNASAGLIVAAAVIALICVMVVKSIATRLILIVMLAAGGFGLYHYRDTLSDCTAGCTCQLLGETLRGENCNAGGS